MKTIIVSEAAGQTLNWLVAVAQGLKPAYSAGAVFVGGGYHEGGYSPSTDWSQGGPIIERMSADSGFRLEERPDTQPLAEAYYDQMRGEYRFHASGPTPLISAMRAYVTSKLGETAEVPEEL